MRKVLGGLFLSSLAALGSVSADDGVILRVSQDGTPGEVRLDWTGGQPAFQIYRSTSASTLVQAANKLGDTTGRAWLDTPPAGGVVFYRIVGPCLTPTPEQCDGQDDDCDGIVDNGCPGVCVHDVDCPAAQYCDPATNRCAADRGDGAACDRSEECVANHCANGVCCATGDCCTTASQCAAYASPPACNSPSTCQGTRSDPVCTASFQCAAQPADDDSGCAGQTSSDCGPYPPVTCTSATTQPSDQAALCAASCAGDAGCDVAAHCDGGACVGDLPPGGACGGPGACLSGLCVDGVCCTTDCTGSCRSCNVAGSAGTCTNVPAGSDPDGDCGAVSCAGYYAGFTGDTCYPKADVAATQAACDGAGACRTQAAECTAQTTLGAGTITCDATCQDPTTGTCAGTAPGTCTNVNPGTVTCGQGICQVTVNQCLNGALNTCTPGTPQTETCNNLDDNCDGTVDNGSFSDAYEPNPDCASARLLAGVGSDQSNSYSSVTLYGPGDVDVFHIVATETDSTCACGPFNFNEDYHMSVTLTVPAGAGSYELCMNTGTCSFPGSNCITVPASQTMTLTQVLAGSCLTTDQYDVYVRVRGVASPGYTCHPYTLGYFFDAGYCGQ